TGDSGKGRRRRERTTTAIGRSAAENNGFFLRPRLPVSFRPGTRPKSRGTDDDSHREICAGKLVVSGKTAAHSDPRRRRFQHVAFSHQDTVEACADGLAVSELLLADRRAPRKVHGFRLFHLALARIQEDRLVRTGPQARHARNTAAEPAR